ncbi:MAG: sulfatase-like hydrolase/transferase [Acidobacteria bacterium]|nr:sulfatase-like hydrolase/transferase [Acidobacteriota bacterium]
MKPKRKKGRPLAPGVVPAGGPRLEWLWKDRSSAWRFLTVCIGIWCGGSLLALLLLNRELRDDAVPGADSALIWTGTFGLVAAEALLTAALLGWAKRLRQVFVAVGSIVGISVLLWLTLVSWTLGAYRAGFLDPSALASYASDLSQIAPFVNFRERLTLVMLMALALTAVTGLFAYGMAPPARQLRVWLQSAAAGFAVALLCWRVIPAATGTTVRAERVAGIVKSRLLPTTTLVWAPVVYAGSGERHVVSVPLARRYDAAAYAARVDPEKRRPNVLVFAVEALRADAIHHVQNGREVMPVLRRLAREGVEFKRAYSSGNESAFSMTSLVSGLHTLKLKSRDTFSDIDYPLIRISDLFSSSYHTAFFSSSNEGWLNMVNFSNSPLLEHFLDAGRYNGETLPPDPADFGAYRAYKLGVLKTGTLDDGTTVGELQRWIATRLHAGDGRPFYAMASLQTSHFPYEQGFQIPALFTPNTFTEKERAQFSFISYPEWALPRMLNRYWNSLAYIDARIAETMEMLRAEGALENTIIAVVGDHGELFLEDGRVTHAAELHDKTIHIGFVLWGAKAYPRGAYEPPVSLMELGPMLLDAAGLPEHAGFQVGMPPGLREPSKRAIAERRPVFSTTQSLTFEDAVIVGRWKYVEQSDAAYAALFDLQADPLEKRNAKTKNPRVTECMKETLRQFRGNQYAYYSSAELKQQYFQPRHDLARTVACEVAFPR